MIGTVFSLRDRGNCVVKALVYDITDGRLVGLYYTYYGSMGSNGQEFRFLNEISGAEAKFNLSLSGNPDQQYPWKYPKSSVRDEATSHRITIREIFRNNPDEPALYVDFDAILLASDVEDCYTFSTVVEQPTYQPYKAGLIVIDVSSTKKLMSSFQFCSGKILSSKPTRQGQYMYTIQSIDLGVITRSHNQLIPAADYFDKTTHNIFRANDDCNNLFYKDEKFVLRNRYFHNRTSTVLLEETVFNKFFTKIEEDAPVKTPAS